MNGKSHEFAFGLGEKVEVSLTGVIIERKQTAHGDQYWVEQMLPNGHTARQWFKGRDVYEHEGDE